MRSSSALEEREAKLHRWMVAAQRGDAVAYLAFLQDVAALLRGYFRRRMSRWPDEIEDLVQESLIAVHVGRATFDARQPVSAWLHAIARYRLIDFLRARAVRADIDAPFDEDAAALLAEPDHDAGAGHHDLHALLARLPERQRLAITLTKLDGLSVREAAHRLGASESAVRVGVHRGMKALIALLSARRRAAP